MTQGNQDFYYLQLPSPGEQQVLSSTVPAVDTSQDFPRIKPVVLPRMELCYSLKMLGSNSPLLNAVPPSGSVAEAGPTLDVEDHSQLLEL